MRNLVDILHKGRHSLVVSNNGEIRTFHNRGIADLYHLFITDTAFLNGAEIADKVIGKGAAALMALGGARNVHADIISEPAFTLLTQHNIPVIYGKRVENIINRQGTGICPVETLCLPCHTAEECLPLINNFMNSKSKN